MVKTHKTLTAIAVVLGLAAPAFSPPAQGQLLKKLTKGLEKVNNALSSPEKKAGKPVAEKTTSATAAADWKPWTRPVRTPFISARTRFMNVERADDYSISNVHSGIFAVKRGNAFEFWRTDGRKLFDADWEWCSESTDRYNFPEFRGGVAVARRTTPNATGKKVICLLYGDGSVRELDPSYETVSQFVDGVALAKQNLGNWQYKYVYLNTRGEKIYTSLSVENDYSTWVHPLRDGLRAFRTTKGTMGFMDASGAVKIAPQYKEVRDFSEGVAWVYEESRNGANYTRVSKLIDTRGNTVYRAPSSAPSSLRGSSYGDVCDGRFYIILDRKVCYFNLRGERLATVDAGIGFYDGYTYVKPDGGEVFDNSVNVVDTAFRTVRRMSDKIVNGADVSTGFTFEPYGLATVGWSNVINPEGDLLITDYNDVKTNTYADNIRQFDEEGYAIVGRILIDRKQYLGLMRPDAHVDWLFSADDGGSFSGWPLPPPVEPIDTAGFNDPRILPRPEPEPPIGPKVVTAQKYNVTVRALPAGGGTATLSAQGPFSYGDYVSFSATPAEGWQISDITYDIDGVGATPQPGVPFAVTADMTITVKFYKEPEIDSPVDNGALQGQHRWMLNGEFPLDITYYAEISSTPTVNTPYGDGTYGFIVPMVDPDREIIGKGISGNFLFLPLKITGYHHEQDGREYLLISGGSFMAHDLKVDAGDPLMNIWMNVLMSINGYDNPGLGNQLYRLEIASRDDDGSMTLGGLEVFSPKAGKWLSGGDKSYRKTTRGFMMTKTSYSLPAELFNGVVIKPAPQRTDVLWYPPESWYKNKGIYDTFRDMMNLQYKSN